MGTRIAQIKSLLEYWPFLVLWSLAMIGSLWIQGTSPLVFHPFLGEIHPLPVFLFAGTLGYGALISLGRKIDIQIFRGSGLHGYSHTVLGAIFFGCLAICLDRVVRFPDDLNVAFPVSLIFYPSIGFLAEVIFHLLPLTMLTVMLISLKVFRKNENVLWLSLFTTALLEPLYQGFFMMKTTYYHPWEILLTGSHIYLISLFQLWVFKKRGFLHMYLVRFLYYIIWHVAWGYLRIQ